MSVTEVTWTPATAATWARDLYADHVEKMNAEGFAAVFTDDAWLRFGNADPVVGKAAIAATMARHFTAFVSVQHELRGIHAYAETLFVEATATYTRHDGGTVTVPSMTVFSMMEHDGLRLAERCQIYVDLAPLFAPG